QTIENSPAAEAGLKPKDRIVAINGQRVQIWEDIGKIITTSAGPLQVTVERNGKLQNFILTPKVQEARSIFGEKIHKKMIGIAPSGAFVKIPMHSVNDVFHYAWEKTVWATGLIVRSLEKLIEGVVPASQMGGIVSIVQVTSQASAIGITTLFALAALISVNLGVLNLLPIPALDGGHIVFNLYEMLFKRPPSEKVFYNLTVAGWVLLLSLMAFTTYNDILRIMRG
ncbi:MAG TPA: RIP metalloprotease RseP, partial [Campylobacteraceae bacterium]|nr:RIP metalloprotease RseP [Campylobacteraceae bacterium]